MRIKSKRKNGIITSLALICAILLIVALPLPVVQAASFTVSKSNVSVENGKSSTITINAPTHTGRIDINSSNSGVATVSDSSLWIENNSKTITILAKSVGSTTITIRGELYDASTDEEAVFTKTVNVTVTRAASSNSGATSSGSSNTGGSTSGTIGSTGETSSGTTGSTNGSQGGITSGSTSNSGTSSLGGQSSSSSKPSSSYSGSNSSSAGSLTSKPSSSSSASGSNQAVQNNTNVSERSADEQVISQEENTIEEIAEETEEILREEVTEQMAEEKYDNAETDNIEEVNSVGKIIIAAIAIIALVLMLLGIGISKNIFKK